MPELAEPPAAPVAPPVAPPSQGFTHPPLAEPAGSEAFGDLESLATENGQPEPAKPDAVPEKPRTADGKFTKPEPAKEPEKPLEKPADKVLTAETPPEKMAPKQLREAYEAKKKAYDELQAKHRELEERASKPADDPEKKTLAERLAAREQRLQELENEVRFADYSKSTEYKERFEKPFEDAYIEARANIADLMTVEKRNELDEVTQAARQATSDDFDNIMRINHNGEAAQKAHDLFGPSASIVMNERANVKRLNNARIKALDEYRAKGGERDKARAMENEAMQKSFSEAVENHAKSIVEKFPKWFKSDETDPRAGEVLDKGQHMLKRVLANGAVLREGDKPWSPAEFSARVAEIRQKAGAFGHLAHLNSKANARIKALETELAGFKASGPGKGEIKTTGEPVEDDSPEGAFDKAFTK